MIDRLTKLYHEMMNILDTLYNKLMQNYVRRKIKETPKNMEYTWV